MKPIPFPIFPPSLDDLGLSAFPCFAVLGALTTIILLYLLRERRGLRPRDLTPLILVVTGAAAIGAHLVEILCYRPDRLAIEGPRLLLGSFDGLASSGALIGGALGLLVVAARLRRSFGDLADALCESLPFGWAVGRIGCFFVHDHPGIEMRGFPAVAYPGGPRLDLGLLEALLLIAVGFLALALRRRPRRRGETATAVLGVYALGRFLLDFARIDEAGARELGTFMSGVVADPRYLGLTPAQWLCLFAFGLLLGQRMRRRRSTRLKAT